MQTLCYEALRIANRRKTHCPDFGITYGLRTAQEQYELYELGRELGGTVVTNCDGYDKKSVHQSGLAIDFVVWIDGKISQDPAQYALVATCFFEAAGEVLTAQSLDMDWGGSFKSISDLGHVELT